MRSRLVNVEAVIEVVKPNDGGRGADGLGFIEQLLSRGNTAHPMVVKDTYDVRVNHSLGRLGILAVVNEEDVLTRRILQHGRSFDACLLQDERGFVVDGRCDRCLRIMTKQRQEACVGDGAANGVGIGAAVANDVDGAVLDDEPLDAAPVERIEALTLLPGVTVLACLADEKPVKARHTARAIRSAVCVLVDFSLMFGPLPVRVTCSFVEGLSYGLICILVMCTLFW